jgi:hypothetical protein
MPESLTIQGWLPWQDLDASQPRSLSGAVRLVSASGQGSANRSLTLLVSARSATGSNLRGGQLLAGLNLSGAAQAAGLGISASGSGASASWTIRQANAPDGAAPLATLSSNADGLLLRFGATVSDGLASQVLQGLQLSAQASTPLLSLDLRLEPAPTVTASLQLTSQWNGAFEGTLSVTNNGSTALSDWSASLLSRYALRSVSDFNLSQTQLADGSWQITLKPPSWGLTLAPGAKASSYMQGVIPSGGSLASLDASLVLLPDGSGSGGGSSDGSSSGGTTGASSGGTTSGGTGDSLTGGTSGGTTSSGDTTSTGGGTGTGTGTGSGTLTPGGRNSGNPGDALWGEKFFAPYVDMTLYPVPDLVGLARQHGVGLFTAAFLQATPTGEAAWAGLPALTLGGSHEQAVAISASISKLRAAGGDVMVSLGGAAGTSLAQFYASKGRSAADLAAAYSRVVDTLQLNRIDFDIEGAAVADPAANRLNSAALALLQQSQPGLEIWYTLPVLPQGLTSDGLNVVRLALDAGVKLDGVNVMAMDYGDSAAPPGVKTMGQYAIDAAIATFSQLSQGFASKGQGFGWNQLGVTPMIGVNDVTSEVFSTADAQVLEDFANSRGLGMLAMWSVARDNPGPLGQVTATHSGLSAPAGSFNAIWGDYGSDPVIAPASTAGSGSSAGTSGTGGTSDTSGTGGTTLAQSTIAVAASTSQLIARDDTAERFKLSYAWGRTLTIQGFNPAQDVLDLGGFWAEGQQAQVVAISGGSQVSLAFNQQQVLLPGVAPASLTPQVLAIWQG